MFQVNYSGTEGEVITFNRSTAVYNNKCLHIADGLKIVYKGGKWNVTEKMALTYWFGNVWFKTDIAKDTNADVGVTFNASSSVSGDISFGGLIHHPDGQSVLALRVDYTAQEGEIITFNNSFAEYYGKIIELDGVKLIYKNGAWAVYNG